MPVPNGLQHCIADSLSKSLSENKKGKTSSKQVSQIVTSSAKQALLEKATIKFVKAEKDANSMLQNLKDKYICLNQTPSSTSSGEQNGAVAIKSGNDEKKQKHDGLPTPRAVLYAPDSIKLTWDAPRKVGAGLSNLGNTCFLNSVLQCLGYTVPLARYLQSGQHKTQCRCNGFCMLCELQSHFNKCSHQHGGALKPLGVLQKLKLIAKQMRWGRQEDAHEFLRYVVDAMQKSCLFGQSNDLEKLCKETTFVHQVFGGYLRSQVRCLQCKTTSNTYDPVLDISVDIKGVNSVERALQRFVQPETLDVDNAYKCLRCKKKVRALKQFTIHRAPKVLTVHLKRFDYHRLMGGKVSRHIDFSAKLNLRPFMSQRQGDSVDYQLYAVLVHSGFSCNSGHYYCYIKAPNQTWYCMNDSHVSQTGINSVLSSEAYILFYSQLHTDKPVSSAGLKKAHHMNDSTKKRITTDNVEKSPKLSLLSKPPLDKTVNPVAKSSKAQLQPTLISTPTSKISSSVEVLPPKPTDTVSNTQSVPRRESVPRRVNLIKLDGLSNGQLADHRKSPKQPSSSCSPTALQEQKASNHDSNANAEEKVTKNSPVKKRKVYVANGECAAIGDKEDSNVPSSKLMSPPRNPVLSPTTRMTTPNWQVSSTNGHLHNHSESDTGSVNSTSSWSVSTTPKLNGVISTENGSHKKRKDKNMMGGKSSDTKRSLKRKIDCRPTQEDKGHVAKQSDNIMNNSSSNSLVPATKKPKHESKGDLQLSNETTPEPALPVKKKKKKKKKSVDTHSHMPSHSSSHQTSGVPDSHTHAKQSTSNSPLAPSHAVAKQPTNSSISEDSHMSSHQLSESLLSRKKKKKKRSSLSHVNGADNMINSIANSMADDNSIENETSHSVGVKENHKDHSQSDAAMGKKSNGVDTDKPVQTDDVENKTAKRKEKKMRFSEPVVKVWDASVDEDDVAFKRQSNASSLPVWDGRRESNISFLMERHASNTKGLGSGVSTWDGGKPEVNRDAERERLTAGYKNSWYDGYEQELDEGRRKKVKVKTRIDKDNRAHFQSIQNNTNKVRQLKREGKLPSLPSYHY